MAVVTTGMGAMNSLLGKLSTLLGDEYKLLKGVRKQVEFLRRELSSMHCLLQTLAGKEKLEPLEKDWRNKVRELSYDIEDCIDLFMHRLGNGDAKVGFMRKTACRLKMLWARHEIASQIQDLKARVMEESQRRDRYKLDSSISNPASAVEIDPRVPALYTEAKGLVAIDGPRDEIIAWLMDETVELKAVSLVGCGGLGKTTLAMEVYRKIGGDFQCRVSVSVSRTLDLTKLLKDMLYQLDQDEYNKSQLFEMEQLIHKVRHILTGKRVVPHFDDTCNKIIRKCGGLPLAINSIASLLATKSEDQGEWERVKDSIGSALENGCALEVMSKILLLSYYDLPLHLKTCLLYLTVFPEDYTINREQLIWRWIAEGFITEQRGRSMEQVAEDCFTELINRNMIQAVKVMYDGRAQACRVHDVMLDLMISLSAEENFVTVLPGHGSSSSLPEKIRRLSVLPNYAEDGGIGRTIRYQSNVRSLSIIGLSKQNFHLSDFHALRVLDIDGCGWWRTSLHLHNIGSLFHNIGSIEELPDQIGNLQYLETLDIKRCHSLRRLPSTIARLGNLVRLFAGLGVIFPDDIGSMKSLQQISISGLSSMGNDPPIFLEQLGRLTKIRELKILGTVSCVGYDEKWREPLLVSLGLLGNCNLRSLCIACDDSLLCSLIDDQRCSLPLMEKLNILGDIRKVPKGILSLRNLAELRLSLETMEEETLDILSAMPTLLYLDVMLTQAPKERLVVGGHGFQYLKVFVLDLGGTGLFFAAYAMPKLQRLHVELELTEPVDGVDGLGLEHLSSLRCLSVAIESYGVTRDKVEAAKASVRTEATRHPNRPTLQTETDMYEDHSDYEARLLNRAGLNRAMRYQVRNIKISTLLLLEA